MVNTSIILTDTIENYFYKQWHENSKIEHFSMSGAHLRGEGEGEGEGHSPLSPLHPLPN